MTGFGFPGRYKLKKTDEFSSVFNFRKRISGKILTIHYMPNSHSHPRMGVVVGKKIAKRAVQRNYMKRALRELFRKAEMTISAVDVIVRPHKSYTRADFALVQSEFHDLIAKLPQFNKDR